MRKRRALEQRLLFIDHRATAESILFEVLGTQGTPWNVKFTAGTQEWCCSCPDFAPAGRAPRRGHRCKHIYFVLARILHVPLDGHAGFRSVDEVEAAMVAQQVGRQFIYDPAEVYPPTPPLRPAAAPSSPTTPTDPDEEKAARIVGLVVKVPQRSHVGEDCAICLEPMSKECAVVFCETMCGKSCHRSCFQRYADHKKTTSCPYCRADMKPDGITLSKRRRRS